MRCFFAACLILLVGLLFSADFELARPAQAHVADPCDGLREWALFVEGEPADDFVARLRDEMNREEALQFIHCPGLHSACRRLGRYDPTEEPPGLGIELQTSELVDLLRRMDAVPQAVYENIPQALQGLGGISTILLLQKLLPFDDEPIADKALYGKIRDYVFVERTGSGHLAVDVCIDRKEFVPLGEDRREYYHWDVEIGGGGFSVEPRADPVPVSDPAAYGNPFPGLPDLVLPASAVDPANPKSIWRRGLDHKLHARGRVIEVRHIYHRKLSDPDLISIPDNDDRYRSTEASCVDLFTPGVPPATFAELVGNDYCLGRCAHPGIINSGD